jgi:Golgi phosphoprotein 3
MTTITRRIVKPTSTSGTGGTYSESASNNTFPSSSNDHNDREKDDERDTDDDKETRLTLMEEVLLLGLKDREVC